MRGPHIEFSFVAVVQRIFYCRNNTDIFYSAVGAFLKLYVQFSKYTAFLKDKNKKTCPLVGLAKPYFCLMFILPPLKPPSTSPHRFANLPQHHAVGNRRLRRFELSPPYVLLLRLRAASGLILLTCFPALQNQCCAASETCGGHWRGGHEMIETVSRVSGAGGSSSQRSTPLRCAPRYPLATPLPYGV